MLKTILYFGIFILPMLAFNGIAESTVSENKKLSLYEKYPERVEDLLNRIDFGHTGLESAKSYYAAGEYSESLNALIRYFREKEVPKVLTPDLPPARKDIVELAEDATRDIFTIQSRTYEQPRNEEGHLIWDDRGPNDDKEWAWMMNRHHHFNFLLTAFLHNENQKYLETISEHLADWILDNPAPDYVTFSTSWRALEAARRIIDSWLAVYVYAKAEPGISDEAIFLMLTSIPEHAESLRDHHSFWGGNHKMTEKMAIAVCAIAWPEFKDSESWIEGAVEVVREELFKQTYPDGSYKELANHYQKVVAENYLRLAKVLSASDSKRVDQEFVQRIEDVWEYFAYVSRPSGFGPLNSDSSLEDNFTYLQNANELFDRSDWTYILSHGKQGSMEGSNVSHYFPWAGHAIMRNGWGADAHWAFFDIGPNGSAHQHDDKLHLSVSIGQHDLLVDSGRYIYKPGPIRNYFRSGAGHNTIRVDGLDSERPPNTVPEPIENRVLLNENWDLFEGRTFFKPDLLKSKTVQQTRTVIYFKNIGWLVVDELLTHAGHQFDTNWNFHPDCVVTRNEEDLNATLPNGTDATLKLLNDRYGEWDLTRGQMEPEIRGWYSWAYNEKKPSTSARFSYKEHRPHVNFWWIAPESSHAKVSWSQDKKGFGKVLVVTDEHLFRVHQSKDGFVVTD